MSRVAEKHGAGRLVNRIVTAGVEGGARVLVGEPGPAMPVTTLLTFISLHSSAVLPAWELGGLLSGGQAWARTLMPGSMRGLVLPST